MVVSKKIKTSPPSWESNHNFSVLRTILEATGEQEKLRFKEGQNLHFSLGIVKAKIFMKHK
jgi:hypothetical protein